VYDDRHILDPIQLRRLDVLLIFEFVALQTYYADLDEGAITKELDACLVNAQEIDGDWQQFEDPYFLRID
jgi:hypothetical protein